MVDWAKEQPFYEKVLINFLFKRNSKILNRLTTKILKTRLANIEKYNIKDLRVICVGNSHLDSAWKWRKSDSRDKKTEPTFSRNIYNLTKMPFYNYSFTANAIIHYEWIKNDYPQLFSQVKEQIDLDKWEFVGGEYVENDCNLVDGESLIRQRLIGQRFYIREFGKPAEVAWMDDVFGWPNSMPQIFVKSGSKYFFTNKFCYSQFSYKFNKDSPDYAGGEKFPFFHFYWESPDGSKILCTWAQHKNMFFRHLKHFNEHSRTIENPEKHKFNTSNTWQEIDKACTDEVIPYIINAYGKGDGGMGAIPVEVMEKMIWETQGPYGSDGQVMVSNGKCIDFMEKLLPYKDRLPIWKDELYLEGHRGTLTTIAMIKENNRNSEILLNTAESISVLSGLLGGDHFQQDFLKSWKDALFLQFHDVLPGSSIIEVYRDAAVDYQSIYANLFSCQDASLMNLAYKMKERIERNAYSIYNSLGWKRNGYLTINAQNFNVIFNNKNAPLNVQKVSFSPYLDNRQFHLGIQKVKGFDYLRDSNGITELNEFEAFRKNLLLIYIPSSMNLNGFSTQNIIALSKSVRPDKNLDKFQEIGDLLIYKDKHFTFHISKITGNIEHLSILDSDVNILGSNGIGYKIFQDDKTNFDAWNINPEYRSKQLKIPHVEDIIIEEKGPLRHTILIKHKPTEACSTFHTRISIYYNENHNSFTINGESLIDWQEDHKILKISTDINSDVFLSNEIICGNPYGIQKRSTNPTTVYQKAQYEFGFQQFASWKNEKKNGSEAENKNKFHQIAFYSQNKYGMYARNGEYEFTLLKAPAFPKPVFKYADLDDDYETRSKIADLGFHKIPWAFEFMKESKTNSQIVKKGFEFNTPIICAPTNIIHEVFTPLSIQTESKKGDTSDNVHITVVKEIEKFMREAPDWFYKPQMSELPFIIRCVEYEGEESISKINIDDKIEVKKVIEVDLLERINNNDIENSDVKFEEKNQTITFTMKPFEIKSLLVIARKILEEED